MTTLTKLIVSIILFLLLFSCEFNSGWSSGVSGDRNVITKERKLKTEFNEIHISRGLDIYLTQGNTESVTVEADSNLHDLIITEVENQILKITAKETIGSASSKKIHVSFDDISRIVATSGSDVYTTNSIEANALNLETNSGSDMSLDVNVLSLSCLSTSGSDLELSGKVNILNEKINIRWK